MLFPHVQAKTRIGPKKTGPHVSGFYFSSVQAYKKSFGSESFKLLNPVFSRLFLEAFDRHRRRLP